MSKITDWLNTNRSVSFTDEGASVVSSNFPSIGDIKLTPNEKFNLPDGTPKYDLLLADGSEVSIEAYPLLWEKLYDGSSVFSQGILVLCMDDYGRFDPDNETDPDWEARYSQTYAKNIGAFAYQDTAPTGATAVLAHTDLDYSLLKGDFYLYAYPWFSNETTTILEGDIQYLDSNGTVLYAIRIYKIAEERAGLKTSYDGVNYDTKPSGGGSFETVNGNMIYDDVGKTMSFSAATVQPESTPSYKDDGVDLSTCVSVRVSGSSKCGGRSGLDAYSGWYMFFDNRVYLPTNTSPYPNFPDRVVADLTEGGL